MAKPKRNLPTSRGPQRKIRAQQTVFMILAGLVIASFLLSMIAR